MIQYDEPIEVTKQQYDILVKLFGGIIAHRCEDGKYWIKVWRMEYVNTIQEIIKSNI